MPVAEPEDPRHEWQAEVNPQEARRREDDRRRTSADNVGPLLDNVALDISPAPGPIMGAGLPGIIIALGALVALRRRRMLAA